jgi:hypothetical protein
LKRDWQRKEKLTEMLRLIRSEGVFMKKKITEDFELTLEKVKKIQNTDPFLVELEMKDWDTPSADVVIDFGDLHFLLCSKGGYNKDQKISPFEIWWGCIYPELQLFVLEFWNICPSSLFFSQWDTWKTFEVYLTPDNIKKLIEILQKGLEYLEKYSKKKK